MGLIGTLLLIAGVVWLARWLSGRLVRRGWSPRKAVLTVGGSLLVGFIALVLVWAPVRSGTAHAPRAPPPTSNR